MDFLAANDRGLQEVSLDFTSLAPAIVTRTASGEVRTPFSVGAWTRSASGFSNGMERLLAVPEHPAVALSGGRPAQASGGRMKAATTRRRSPASRS